MCETFKYLTTEFSLDFCDDDTDSLVCLKKNPKQSKKRKKSLFLTPFTGTKSLQFKAKLTSFSLSVLSIIIKTYIQYSAFYGKLE